MDGNTIKLEAADTLAQQQGFATFWKNAKRKFESILNSISNTMPVHDLDAYERQRIETLVDALERAAQIRRKSQDLEYRPHAFVESLERTQVRLLQDEGSQNRLHEDHQVSNSAKTFISR